MFPHILVVSSEMDGCVLFPYALRFPNVGFISLSLITPKHFGTAVSLIINVSFWQHLSQIHGLLNFAWSAPTKCVLCHFISQPYTDEFLSFSPKTRKQSDLSFPQLHNPKKEVLSCNRKIWVSFPPALPAPKQQPVSFPSARWSHKKWFHSPQPCTPETICPSFPWPHGPKNVLDLLSLSLVSQILVGFASVRLAVPTFL